MSIAGGVNQLKWKAKEKNADLRARAAKVLARSEANARNEVQLDYDERNPFELDCRRLTPLYRGAEVARCALCASAYAAGEPGGDVCVTCGVGGVGARECIGLVTGA